MWALFVSLGLMLGVLVPRVWWPLAALAILAEVLEVVQWWFGRYPRIELADIPANEAGLTLAWLLLWWILKSPARR